MPAAEPLTEREVVVLRLLGGTLSLGEIGQELFLSANTIKTHAQRIYRKLGLTSRHDAVEPGRQAGILIRHRDIAPLGWVRREQRDESPAPTGAFGARA